MEKTFHKNARLFVDFAVNALNTRAIVYIDENKKTYGCCWDNFSFPEDMYFSHLVQFQNFAFSFFSAIQNIPEYQFLNFIISEEIVEYMAKYFVHKFFGLQSKEYGDKYHIPAIDKIDLIDIDNECCDCILSYDSKDKLVYLLFADNLH